MDLFVCLWVDPECEYPREQKRASDPGLELEDAGVHLTWVLGTSSRAANAPKCGGISPAQNLPVKSFTGYHSGKP